MHTHSNVALLAAALLAVSSNFALAADKKVAFVPQIIGIPYFDAMKAGGEEAAAKFGVDFIYQGPVDTNPVDQMQIVQNLIDQGRFGARRFQHRARRRGREGETCRAVHLRQRRADVWPRAVCRTGDRRGFGRRDHRRDG
jgi:hypothetical protein